MSFSQTLFFMFFYLSFHRHSIHLTLEVIESEYIQMSFTKNLFSIILDPAHTSNRTICSSKTHLCEKENFWKLIWDSYSSTSKTIRLAFIANNFFLQKKWSLKRLSKTTIRFGVPRLQKPFGQFLSITVMFTNSLLVGW